MRRSSSRSARRAGACTGGSASCPAPPDTSRASVARCRRSATWTASSRSYEGPDEPRGPAMNDQRPHFRNVVLLWLLATVILTPIVVFVLGPGLPPGNGSVEAHGQVVDNTVLMGLATPVALAVLVYFGYALWAFRERQPDAVVDGPPIRGNSSVQFWWLTITTVLVLFLA